MSCVEDHVAVEEESCFGAASCAIATSLIDTPHRSLFGGREVRSAEEKRERNLYAAIGNCYHERRTVARGMVGGVWQNIEMF